MKSTYVTHPNKFCIDGFVFKVISDSVLSEEQAANAAVHFCKTNQLYKQSKEEIHTVDMTVHENAQGL